MLLLYLLEPETLQLLYYLKMYSSVFANPQNHI